MWEVGVMEMIDEIVRHESKLALEMPKQTLKVYYRRKGKGVN